MRFGLKLIILQMVFPPFSLHSIEFKGNGRSNLENLFNGRTRYSWNTEAHFKIPLELAPLDYHQPSFTKAHDFYPLDSRYLNRVELNLTLDKSEYIWNEKVQVQLKIRNRSREFLKLIFPHTHKVRFTLSHLGTNHAQTVFDIERVDIPSTLILNPNGELLLNQEFDLTGEIGKLGLLGLYKVDAELFLYPSLQYPKVRREFKVVPTKTPIQEENTFLEVTKGNPFEVSFKLPDSTTSLTPKFGKNHVDYLKKRVLVEEGNYIHTFQFIAKSRGLHSVYFDEYNPHRGRIYATKRHEFKIRVEEREKGGESDH